MANSKSALKRANIAERNRLRNKAYKSAIRTLTKKFLVSLDNYASNPTDELKKDAAEKMSDVYSKIDRSVKRGVLHRNAGARKKSRLAKRFKSSSMAVSS
ncbi:MAG: 30S ribosomal protein S20 [Cyanobacteria bacterium P01_A01_bin.80]